MMQYALLMLGLSALVARAQEEGLSKFTVGDWNDISYGQPKLLSWTFGNGRVPSPQSRIFLSSLANNSLACQCPA